MYASKAPRDNNDPAPYIDREDGPGNEIRQSLGDGWTEYEPRPEFDHVQHNEPNRVLLHIRKNWDGHTEKTKGHLISIHGNLLKFAQENHDGEGWERFTDETLAMIDHARRVLARLAGLEASS